MKTLTQIFHHMTDTVSKAVNRKADFNRAQYEKTVFQPKQRLFVGAKPVTPFNTLKEN